MKRTLDISALAWGIVLVGTAAAAIADISAPDRPGSFRVTAVTRSQVTLAWTAPKEDTSIISDPAVTASAAGAVAPTASPSPSPTSGPCTSYDIRYSTAPIGSGTWAAAIPLTGEPVPAAPGTTQSFNVTGLAANTTYYFAIKAVDEAGNLSPLATTSGTTAADTEAPAMVAGLVVVDNTDNGVTLSWTAPADDDGAKVATYDLRYGMGSIDASTWASATPVGGEPEPKAPGSAEMMVITDLGDGAHAFALVAIDAAGNPGPVSETVLVTLTGRIGGGDDERPSPCGQAAAGRSALVLAVLVLAAAPIRRA